MTPQIFLLVILLAVSGASMLRFRLQHFAALAVACVAVGLTYWLIEVGGYVLAMLSSGRFPYDAAFMIVPALLFSAVFAVLIAPPAILILEKLGLLATLWSVAVAAVLGAMALWFTRGQSPAEHPINFLVGAMGGLAFVLAWRRRKDSASAA